jgi:hypothetical protein
MVPGRSVVVGSRPTDGSCTPPRKWDRSTTTDRYFGFAIEQRGGLPVQFTELSRLESLPARLKIYNHWSDIDQLKDELKVLPTWNESIISEATGGSETRFSYGYGDDTLHVYFVLLKMRTLGRDSRYSGARRCLGSSFIATARGVEDAIISQWNEGEENVVFLCEVLRGHVTSLSWTASARSTDTVSSLPIHRI